MRDKSGAIPATRVYDIVLIMRHYQTEGAIATPAEIEKPTGLLGHPPCSYRDFAKSVADSWKTA